MEQENENEITRKEYDDFVEALDAVKEHLHSNLYSSLTVVILRRLEETSTPIFKKIRQNLPKRERIRERKNELNSDDKEYYGN